MKREQMKQCSVCLEVKSIKVFWVCEDCAEEE